MKYLLFTIFAILLITSCASTPTEEPSNPTATPYTFAELTERMTSVLAELSEVDVLAITRDGDNWQFEINMLSDNVDDRLSAIGSVAGVMTGAFSDLAVMENFEQPQTVTVIFRDGYKATFTVTDAFKVSNDEMSAIEFIGRWRIEE